MTQADTPNPLTPMLASGPLRAAITAVTRVPESVCVAALLNEAHMAPAMAAATHTLACNLARRLREQGHGGGQRGLVQGLLQEFSLSSHEGVALMCLAEALLRIPDRATRDALIRDKIGGGDWGAHVNGPEASLFVNAAAWGLLITGKLVATHSQSGLSSALARIMGRGGDLLIRASVDRAMRLMGEQFVTGEDIEEAISHARQREREGFRYSYDMLGEAALTMADADRYLASYQQALEAIGKSAGGRGVLQGPGLSVKLSALHPRYQRAQVKRVQAELYPRLLQLAQSACRHDIGLNIDAEEADRLELSLDLLERLCFEPSLSGWNGVGFVLQAYQKRCPAVVDWLIDLARRSGRRIMVRLVKGAYWDAEIKRAQIDGLDGYPVYTRKRHTDVCYLACAKRLLAAADAVYPQFATHNAQTLAAIHQMAGPDAAADAYEFQCLHGMGEPLYAQVVRPISEGGLGRPCRIYAPVGTHETLLAYLVRRLLENGANTSFVHEIADHSVPVEQLVQNPIDAVQAAAEQEGALGLPHPKIPLPRAIYGDARANARGLDLANETQLAALAETFVADAAVDWQAAPMRADPSVSPGRDSTTSPDGMARAATDAAAAHDPSDEPAAQPVYNPADRRDLVGHVRNSTLWDIEAALAAAEAAGSDWAATTPAARAALLVRAADEVEARTERLVPLLVREAGKTCANAVAEVREAVDFLRYYAMLVRRDFDNATHRPLGTVLCISPWNFPLAIFAGQIAAALAAGNCVIAKPAEQTPLVAAAITRMLHAAGIPRGALQLLPGPGETIGAALVADARVQGVLFTGSTAVARLLQRTLSQRLGAHDRPVPLIAETGGQNAMIVDSSALPEQAVADVLASAFDSAGQRCSALRVLCVQQEAAPHVLQMLEGALRELRLGDPRALAVDVGPVIDAEALSNIERHVQAMRAQGRRVLQPAAQRPPHGTFAVPTVIEIERLDELEREVFGPVLHVLRYQREQLPQLIEQINATGYGLTFGVHTRIDETVAQVTAAVSAGNIYVNRNMVGATVGVQPFGGVGLSGTGPKAGGPLYLLRLLAERPDDSARRAVAQSGAPAVQAQVPGLSDERQRRPAAAVDAPLRLLRDWAETQGMAEVAAQCERFTANAPSAEGWRLLNGPTGESNLYALTPRRAVLCLTAPGPNADADRLVQLAAVFAVGSQALWPQDAQVLWQRLPLTLRSSVPLVADDAVDAMPFDTVLQHAPADAQRVLAGRIAARDGAIVSVVSMASGDWRIPLERLLTERSLSINSAAAGGNASLMSIEA
ncbi:MAG: trifunctional transcriptional regulator/proline dehydrogenase/L-glutamate gamma-semialdehyde dehydrogenase [Burkholderiaceae bacterium]